MSDFFFVFSPAAHALDLGPDSNIVSLTIPLITRSPAVFHAMVSCSAIFLSQKQPSWQSVAIRHHCKTLRHLTRETKERNLDDPAVAASTLAVVMMLHLFQKFDSSSQTPSCTHLLAAQQIFLGVCSRGPPHSILGPLVIEAFVYRIAINSTFHPELLRTYTYLEGLLTTYLGSSGERDSKMESFRCALWLGAPTELYDMIYKISFLRQKLPLSANRWVEAGAIGQRLTALCVSEPPDTAGGVPRSKADVNTAMYHARGLYVRAAQLLLLTVMEPEVKAVDTRVQHILQYALDDMAATKPDSPMLMFPVAVLGTAAVDERDRDLITSQLNRMRFVSGDREVENVLLFLQGSWGQSRGAAEGGAANSDSTARQLDIWLDDGRLKTVTM